LIGQDIGEFTKEMSELNALRLRGRLQEFGFRFLNYRLPEFRRFIYPHVGLPISPQNSPVIGGSSSRIPK
jgi:hypothetical protein